MPIYHFDLRLGEHLVRDIEGAHLPDDAAARSYAFADVRDLAVTHRGILDHLSDCTVTVLDSTGRLVFNVPFTDVCSKPL